MDAVWQPAGHRGQRFWPSLAAGLLLELLLLSSVGRWAAHRPTPRPVPARPRTTRLRLVPWHPDTPPTTPSPPVTEPSAPPKPRAMPLARARLKPRPAPASVAAPPRPRPTAMQSPLPVVPAPRPTPGPTAAQRASAIERYAGRLRGLIRARARVPEAARVLRLAGRTRVTFMLAPDGTLTRAQIARSSGIPLLDRAALACVQAGHYPPFVPTMPAHPLPFTVTVILDARR